MFKKFSGFLRRYLLEGTLLFLMMVFFFVQSVGLMYMTAIILAYFLIVLGFNDNFVSRGIKKGMQDIKMKRYYWVLILIFVALLLIWQFSLEAIFLLPLFLAFVLYAWDSRIIATGALVSLASCPILLLAKQDARAEQMAVYAYYFLVMTVVLQITEFRREGKDEVKSNDL